MILLLLFSIIVHEVAHGYTAYLCGDPTAKAQGRLTLNPFAHIDMVGTILFPLMLVLTKSPILFGWAKPVPVNIGLLRNPRRDHLLVSLSGITANLLLAILFTVLYGFSIVLLQPPLHQGWLVLVSAGIEINVLLAVFNIMPIPPLDGSWILYQMLPRSLARIYLKIFPFGFLILVLLLMTNTLNYLMIPLRTALYRLLSEIIIIIVR